MSEVGDHAYNCCIVHGCKYGDNNCPVTIGIIRQKHICATCSSEGMKSVDQVINMCHEKANSY